MNLKVDFNNAILKISMKIRKDYPKLLEYLNEMAVTIPHKVSPKVTKNYRTAITH